MSNEKLREEFEAWFSVNVPDINNLAAARAVKHMMIKELAFLTWQASRECLVIEMPPSIGVTPIGGDGIQEFIDCNGEYLHGHLVVEALTAAGVKYK